MNGRTVSYEEANSRATNTRITDQEDCAVGKGTTHEEPSDVLVVCVQGCLSDQVVSEEGIRCEGTQVASRKRGSRSKCC